MNARRYLVIDDDPIDIFICHTVLKKELGNPPFHHFSNGEKAIQFFKNEFSSLEEQIPTVVFLDINMSVMDGWEFLDSYKNVDESIKDLVSIYMFSSSLDTDDRERAFSNKYVTDYIVKPMVSERVKEILTSHAKVK